LQIKVVICALFQEFFSGQTLALAREYCGQVGWLWVMCFTRPDFAHSSAEADLNDGGYFMTIAATIFYPMKPALCILLLITISEPYSPN